MSCLANKSVKALGNLQVYLKHLVIPAASTCLDLRWCLGQYYLPKCKACTVDVIRQASIFDINLLLVNLRNRNAGSSNIALA